MMTASPSSYDPDFHNYDPFLHDLHRRTSKEKDQDAIVAAIGERGSTKSGCSIAIGNMLDSQFSLPDDMLPRGFRLMPGEVMPRVVFSPEDYMKLLFVKKLPPGSVIIFDEIGVAGDARQFLSKKNIMLKQTLETVRSRRLILFLTAPTLSSFDVAIRRSLTHYMRCLGKGKDLDTGKSYGLVKPFRIKTDPISGEVKLYKLRYKKYQDLLTKSVNYQKIYRPPAYMEKPYKRLKKFIQNKLYENYYNQFLAIKEKQLIKVSQAHRKATEKVLSSFGKRR